MMQRNNPEVALRELAKSYRRRVSDCRAFDANVCSWEVKPKRPWELIPVTGCPFTLKTQLTIRGQKLDAKANNEYLGLFLEADIEIDPLSLNQPERNTAYLNVLYHAAGHVIVGNKSYPVFTLGGSLSATQLALLNSDTLRGLVQNADLQVDESLHVSAGGLRIYIHYRSVDSLQRILNLGTTLVSQMRASEESPELEQLPKRFQPLNSLLQKWATSDDEAREALIEAADRSDLLDLIAAVSPHMAAINAHLDSFGDQPLDPSAIKLSQLAEVADEVKRLLEENETNPHKRRGAPSI